MFTVEEYRARYARSSSEELLYLLATDPGGMTPAARQAIAEEIAHRRLDPGFPLIESGDVEIQRPVPARFIYPKAPLPTALGRTS